MMQSPGRKGSVARVGGGGASFSRSLEAETGEVGTSCHGPTITDTKAEGVGSRMRGRFDVSVAKSIYIMRKEGA